jgi:hypothetical protein
MKITSVKVFIVGNRQFPTLEKAVSHELDVIGEFVQANVLNSMGLSPRERITIVENIIRNREALIGLLSPQELQDEDSE